MSYIVEDSVHKNLSLPAYVEDIIKTEEFQRLQNLKQLGSYGFFADANQNTFTHVRYLLSGISHFVFETAVHTRFQHCIGTAYLCSRLLDILEKNSNQQIDKLLKKCVIVSYFVYLF